MAEYANDYDNVASLYAEHSDASAWNAHYERPAILRLAGDIEGLDVLDAGCGAGPLTAQLLERRASVTGLDLSPGLLAIARARLGPGVPLVEADLADPLPFPDGAFDVVVSSLALHYLEHWGGVLAEFHRVLAPAGRLAISTHHPFMDHAVSGHPDYFATYAFDEVFTFGGRDVAMRFWHRPLTAMITALGTAGFRLDVIEEPAPDPVVEHLDPVAWQSLTTTPRFLFIAAHRD